MRDLSLHILDLVENSLRAAATTVRVSLRADARRDLLTVLIEDNGSGLGVGPHQATDPFFTTKGGKRVGLGLSLLRATAEQAGGGLELRRGDLGGLAVEARMQLSHVDRCPLGDLAATFSTLVCANPHLDLRLDLDWGEHQLRLNVQDVAKEMAAARGEGILPSCPAVVSPAKAPDVGRHDAGKMPAVHADETSAPLAVDPIDLGRRVGKLVRQTLPVDGSCSILT